MLDQSQITLKDTKNKETTISETRDACKIAGMAGFDTAV